MADKLLASLDYTNNMDSKTQNLILQKANLDSVFQNLREKATKAVNENSEDTTDIDNFNAYIKKTYVDTPVFGAGGTSGTGQPREQLDPAVAAQKHITSLADAQKQARLAELGKARDSSLMNLETEKAGIQPAYYNKRANESTQSQLGAKNFAEFMANRGQTNAGAAAQGELNRNVALQGNIGALNQQEQSLYDDIGRRVTGTNNAYNSDVASANAGIDAQKLQNLIAQMNTDRGFGLQEKQIDNQSSQFEKSLASGQDQFYQNLAQQKSQFDQNLANNKDQFGQNINLETNKFDYSKLDNEQKFAYTKQKDAIDQQFKNDQFGWQKAMDKLDNEFRYDQLNQQNNQFYAGLDFQKSQAKIDNDYKSGAISRQDAQQAWDNNMKQQQIAEDNRRWYEEYENSKDQSRLNRGTQIDQYNQDQAFKQKQLELQQAQLAQENALKQQQLAAAQQKAGGTIQQKADVTAAKNNAYSNLYKLIDSDIQLAREWLNDNSQDLISALGATEYDKMRNLYLSAAKQSGNP